MIKNVLMTMRTSIKLISLLVFGAILIVSLFVIFYKPIYSVTINGEFIGYTRNKSELQDKINHYMDNGNQDNENVAFAQIDKMPEYKLCLLKRGITTNDEEIYNIVTGQSTTYYKYYAILLSDEEKMYVSDFATAEDIIAKLKEKKTNNIDKISVLEKYDTSIKEFTTVDNAVSQLYEEKPVVVAKRYYNTSSTVSYKNIPINITFIRPISGIITSRFGSMSEIRSSSHKGLDIAAPTGTKIAAAAAGTVTFTGTQGTWGKLVIISHGDGVETYYAHCSKIYAQEGQHVNQGDIIAAVGTTGYTTGPHLHLEVRVNGVRCNPQNYVY